MSSSNINSKITLKTSITTAKKIASTVMEATTALIANKDRLVITTTDSVTTRTIAVAKKATSTARTGRQH